MARPDPQCGAANPAAKPPSKPGMGKPSPAALSFLILWHGVLAGGFIVAMLTGNGVYGAHSFAGVVLIFAVLARLLLGAAFPKGHVLSFPWPKLASLGQGTNGVRRFVSHTMGVAMLAVCALAALTGWYAWHAAEAHSQISYFALSVILLHIGLVLFMQGWKKVEAFARARS